MAFYSIRIYFPPAGSPVVWQTITSLVLDGIASPHIRRAYAQALEEFPIRFIDGRSSELQY